MAVIDNTEIDEIRERLAECPIPEGAVSDWDGTNHYEIQVPKWATGFWWLSMDGHALDSATEEGKRLGAVLDYACAYKRDVGALLESIAELKAIANTTAMQLRDEIVSALSARNQRDEARRELAEERARNAGGQIGENWQPCPIPGYEQRITSGGHLETRPTAASMAAVVSKS